MALPDAALNVTTLSAVMLCFLDILDGETPDPIRAALAPAAITVPGGLSGDADLDGQTFVAVDSSFISVGAVSHGEGGTDTVTISLSGQVAGDTDLLNQLALRTNFQGRAAKLWLVLVDAVTLVPVYSRNYYSGYMNVPKLALSPPGAEDGQSVIMLDIENYLSSYSGGAPSRTLLSQRDYDADDDSGDATAGAANGTTVVNPGFQGGGGGAPRGDFNIGNLS